MTSDPINGGTSRGMWWTGCVLSALPILGMLVAPIIFGTLKFDAVQKGMVDHGYPSRYALLILLMEIGCAVIYAIPGTAVLGAILMTGYLGGAVATHVRVGEGQFVTPAILGVIVWLGLYFRDARLRALVPWRQ